MLAMIGYIAMASKGSKKSIDFKDQANFKVKITVSFWTISEMEKSLFPDIGAMFELTITLLIYSVNFGYDH